MANRKRILMITPRYSPAIGGVEKHLEKINQYLINVHAEITVLTCSHNANLPPRECANHLQIIRLPKDWQKKPHLMYRWMISNRNKLFEHDIIHIHGVMPLLLWYLPLLVIRPLIPVYATFHGFERDPVPLIFRFLRKIAKRLVRKTLCIGQFIEGVYGIQCDSITIGAVDKPTRVAKEKEGAIFVGRLESDTGILEHIAAVRILKEKHHIEIPLTICGSGSLEEEIKAYSIAHDLDIRFEGWVQNPLDIMKSKQICLAAGYLTILDAFSLGLPVIGIATSSMKLSYLTAVRKIGGPISIQTSSDRVATEIVRVINNPALLKVLGKKGREIARNHSWKQLASVYIQLWKS